MKKSLFALSTMSETLREILANIGVSTEINSPFMVDAQTRQPCYRVPLLQVFQADRTFPSVFTQDIL